MNSNVKKVMYLIIFLFGLLMTVHLTIGRNSVTTAVAAEQAATTYTYLPTIANNYNAIPTIFGTQLYGEVTASHRFYPYIIESNTDWIRTRIWWSWVEPTNTTPANYNWSKVDNVLSLARADSGNLNLIVTVDYAPSWAAPISHGTLYSDKHGEFAEFMTALVERYDGDGLDDAPGSPVVLYWEMYNEPDGGSTGWNPSWGEDGDEYALMLKAIYPAVKAANPNAKVVFGGLAHDWFTEQGGPFVRSFLDDVLADGGGDYFDVMNFHVYPSFALGWGSQGPGVKEKAAALRTILAENGFDKPFVITEAGWTVDGIPPDWPGGKMIQASYVVELFTQSMAADIDVMIWWMFYDPASTERFGLINEESGCCEKRPSFTAFQTIIAELGYAQFIRQLTDGQTGAGEMEAYQFKRANQDIYVAWLDPVDNGNAIPLRLPASQATVRTMLNLTSVVTDAQDGTVDGQITIWISAEPVYIEIASP